ncbi:MAG: 50S ribosomal protein L23 [Oscillospiraceae bacterium]|jgi:large subunit ribosomal protein L23|nr:50S ribosomal protein L23 [Oscillospiraceae bacterium]
MLANEIVISPIVTEKTMAGNQLKKYTFEVAKNAGKIQIKKAVEKLFGVQVEKVNTMHVRGHLRRQRSTRGYTPSWKKAVVKLTENSKTIDFFDGMV